MNIRIAAGIILLILLGYGFLEARPLLSGPAIALSSPTENASVESGIVTIAGVAKRFTALTLNGAPLLADESGAFSRLIVLPRGSAILTLTATDRFGRTITTRRSVYVP